jgi:putative peptidoglycan lipid II flippase
MRLVSIAETFLCYLCLPGILLLLYYNRNPAVWACLGFSAFFLQIYGFTIANLGTLYRLRYGYLFVMVMLGVLGWMTWLERTGRLQRLRARIGPVEPDLTPSSEAPPGDRPQRSEALGRGLVVMGLTLLCFVGFFVRDVLMAHTFGLGGDLDNFFLALVIPMFIVTVLCMPMGTVFIPAYLEIKERVSLKAATTLVTSTSSWTTAVLLLICVVLFLFGPAVFPLFHLKDSITESGQLAWLFDIALPILLFSGMVILGNAVLNAHGRAVLTSAAQLVVPAVAILSLVLFGERHGVQAVMYGMVVGQLLNLLIVQFYLSRQGGSLWAKGGTFRFRRDTRDGIAPFMGQYLPQVASAFFISVAALVSTMLAMSLPEGAVSAFNLGNKVVLFVSGLVGTAVATVLLPYFSAMVSKNHLVEARRELSLFLLFATFVSVPISAMLYIWAEPIIRLAFEGGTFGSDSTIIVTSVMQYSVAQLPFLICNTLLLKFATATKHAFAISAMAVVGLLVNIISSMMLMQYMGVAGIALGMTLSMLASTVLLTLVLVKNRHITGFDAVVMLMNWLLYVTLLIGVHFGSTPSIVATGIAYLVLLTGYFKSLALDRFARVRMQT